jgi:pimeloyl-ACP methyl ester carboxylesterase
MATYQHDDVSLHYEVHGKGDPVLLFAPGGMRSAIGVWDNMPWNPIDVLADEFQVIAMDQRNAGQSTAPVGPDDGWATYTADHIALLDHLGIERCHLLGCCIGGSYILGLIDAAPERVKSAVLQQPIGASDDNKEVFAELFGGWAEELKSRHPDVAENNWEAFGQRMFGGDFVYNVSREVVSACPTPLLVLMGNDLYHPEAISREIAALAPNATLVEDWKAGTAMEAGREQVRQFLRDNA